MKAPQIESYPYPVAFSFARASNSKLPYLTRLNCLVDSYKALVKVNALSVISDYIASQQYDQAIDQLLRRQFIDRDLSLGHWIEILRETARFFVRRSSRPCFIGEIGSFYFNGKNMTAAAKRFEKFLSFRNDELGHPIRTAGEAEAEQLLAEQSPRFSELLTDMEFLCKYWLVIPEEISRRNGTRIVTKSMICSGTQIPSYPNCNDEFAVSSDVERGQSLLLAREGKIAEHVLLYPLLFPEYQISDEMYDLYSYERSHRAVHDRSGIARLVYHGTRIRNTLEVTQESPLAKALESFAEHFANLIGEVLKRDVRPSATQSKSYYFNAQRSLLDRYRDHLFHRNTVVNKLSDFINLNDSGYACLIGAPGQGKTACLANLVNEHGYVHHFFAREGGRNRYLLAMRSILQQLIEKHQLPFGIPEGMLETEKIYDEALTSISHSLQESGGPPEVVVIDALDESDLVDQPEGLSQIFPSILPASLFFLISSRPGSTFNQTKVKSPVAMLELEPLSNQEIRRLLEINGLPADAAQVQKLIVSTGGNPLFLKVQIEELLHEGIEGFQHLKTRLEDCFEARIERTAEKFGMTATLGVIGLLAVAQTGLSLSEFAQLMPDVELFRIRKVLSQLGEFLIESDGRLRFFHKRFEEYVQQHVFTSGELARYHRRLIDHFEPWSEKKSSYGFSYLSTHYLGANDRDGLSDLLTVDFWAAKCRFQGSAADLFGDASIWIKAELSSTELLDRLSSLAASPDVMLSRKAIACICDLRSLLPVEMLVKEIKLVSASDDFWIGCQCRKAIERLKSHSVAPADRPNCLRIGVLNYIGHLPLFLAREAGLYDRAGLDIELLFFDGYDDRMQAVVERQVDGLATTIDEVLLAADRGLPLKIVARVARECDSGKVVDGILVRRPMTSVRELKGLRVAIEKDSPSLFLLHHVMQNAGLQPWDVQPVFFRSSDDAGAALRDREIDAAVLWEPWLHQAQRDSHCSILMVPDIDVIEDVLAFRPEILEAYSKEIETLMKIWCDLVENLDQHKALLVKLASERFGIGSTDYDEIASNLSYAGRQTNIDFFQRTPASRSYLKLAGYTQDVLMKAGLVYEKIDLEQLVSWPFAENAYAGQ